MKAGKIWMSSVAIILVLGLSAFVPSSEHLAPSDLPEDRKTSFPEFLSHFEKVSTPFEVGLGDHWKYDQMRGTQTKATKKKMSRKDKSQSELKRSQQLRDFIPMMDIGLYSRSGPPEILPVARFYPNEQSVAVIFMTYKRFWGKHSNMFQMVIYDLKGNVIPKLNEETHDSHVFDLARCSRYETQTFSIDSHGHINKTSYKNIWKKDVDKKGAFENEVIAYEKMKTEVFRINEGGWVKVMEETPIDANARASLD